MQQQREGEGGCVQDSLCHILLIVKTVETNDKSFYLMHLVLINHFGSDDVVCAVID